MKTIFILFAIILFAIPSQAQLIANAGPDVNICSHTSFDTTVLGSLPSATGGVPPYQYKWSIIPYQFATLPYVYTSDILVDSTLSNPQIYNTPYLSNDSLLMYLEVTDSVNTKAYDSVWVFTSNYNIHAAGQVVTITAGDSVQAAYGGAVGGFPPIQWLWRPNHGLTDSTSASPGWLKPTQNTSYYCITTDRFGCSDTTNAFIHITVLPLSLKDINQESIIKTYPNPVTDRLVLSFQDGLTVQDWQLYTVIGKCINGSESSSDVSIDFSNLSSGTYNLVIHTNKGIIRKKVIKP